jgi:hypothetical protein
VILLNARFEPVKDSPLILAESRPVLTLTTNRKTLNQELHLAVDVGFPEDDLLVVSPLKAVM